MQKIRVVDTSIPLYYRRQYAESWRKMQELRAQIQAQLKLADTLKKISEAAGKGGGARLRGVWRLFIKILILGIDDIVKYLGNCVLVVCSTQTQIFCDINLYFELLRCHPLNIKENI